MVRTRAFDETVVIESIAQQFRSTGYAATSLDDIMRASGLGKGSLYGAFGDKRAMFLQSFDRYCAMVTASLNQALTGAPDDALNRLESVLLGSAGTKGGSATRACFLAKTTAELAASDEEIATKARTTFEVLAAAIQICVRQAQSVGHISATADPQALASLVLSVLRGNEALAEAGVDPATLLGAATSTIATLKSGVPHTECTLRRSSQRQ